MFPQSMKLKCRGKAVLHMVSRAHSKECRALKHCGRSGRSCGNKTPRIEFLFLCLRFVFVALCGV